MYRWTIKCSTYAKGKPTQNFLSSDIRLFTSKWYDIAIVILVVSTIFIIKSVLVNFHLVTFLVHFFPPFFFIPKFCLFHPLRPCFRSPLFNCCWRRPPHWLMINRSRFCKRWWQQYCSCAWNICWHPRYWKCFCLWKNFELHWFRIFVGDNFLSDIFPWPFLVRGWATIFFSIKSVTNIDVILGQLTKNLTYSNHFPKCRIVQWHCPLFFDRGKSFHQKSKFEARFEPTLKITISTFIPVVWPPCCIKMNHFFVLILF